MLTFLPVAGFSQDVFIAGVDPSERPADAPVISETVKDPSWFAAALSGVEEPFPDSLGFLEDQGAWFNPFLRPGMTGPYDIRDWH
jgi:hypothetical protein